MDNNSLDYQYHNVVQLEDAVNTKRFMANVFAWMFLALAISGAFAYYFANDPALLSMLVDYSTNKISTFGMVVIFAPLAFVLVMNFGLQKISFPILTVLYIAYSALMGISLSFVLLAYTASSVVGVFITCSAVFGVMAVAGYITHQDLTSFGSLMMMGLVGIIIASVVNMFVASAMLDKIISYVGVAVFVGLTAYKVQQLKNMGNEVEFRSENGRKLALMGAMSLYITFINLFLSLLRLFGSRK